jgi:hypothetical protein
MSDVRDEQGKFVPGNRMAWLPGQSGNPKGRPKGSKNGTATIRRLARQMSDHKSGLTAEEVIASRLVSAAMDGKEWAIKEYYNRVEGKPGIRVESEDDISFEEYLEQNGLTIEDVRAELKRLEEHRIDVRGEIADKAA